MVYGSGLNFETYGFVWLNQVILAHILVLIMVDFRWYELFLSCRAGMRGSSFVGVNQCLLSLSPGFLQVWYII